MRKSRGSAASAACVKKIESSPGVDAVVLSEPRRLRSGRVQPSSCSVKSVRLKLDEEIKKLEMAENMII
jgi:hypothetical protein